MMSNELKKYCADDIYYFSNFAKRKSSGPCSVYIADEADEHCNVLLAEQDAEIEKLNQKIELLHAKIRGMERFRDRLRRIIR